MAESTLKKFNWKALFICIAIPEVVGFLSAFFTKNTFSIFSQLKKPFFAPPGWIFGPVWALLYAMMGAASFFVWEKGPHRSDVRSALTFYGIQLVFNFLWSILFFALRLRGVAFIEILVLLVLIIITTVKFFRISKLSGWLMIPYIGWVSFASVLNYSIYALNK